MGLYYSYIGLGILLLLAGFNSLKKAKAALLQCSKKTTAIIIDVARKKDITGQLAYSPILSYKVNGETYRVTDVTGSHNRKKYPVGKEVGIYYDPTDPTKLCTVAASNRKTCYFFMFMGLFFIYMGVTKILGVGH